MPIFTFSAAKRDGAVVKGEREAADEKTLAQSLKSEELLLLQAKVKGKGLAAAGWNFDVGKLFGRLKPIGLVEKMFFARNLSVMVEAGLSLTRSLEALSEETRHPRMKEILADVKLSVTQGKTFAESLGAHQEVFGNLFVHMVEVGETTGKLAKVLKILAKQMQKDYDIRKRVKGAMIYPAIILIALIVIGTFMMIYVVPTLTSTIRDLNVDIPPTTQVIISVSDFLANYSFWVLGGMMALAVAIWRLLKTAQGKELFDRVIIRVPIFGPLIKKFNTARFCRTLSYLISSGVPIVRSLEITSSVLGNVLYKRALEEASKEVQRGTQLHTILEGYEEQHIFQPIVIQMISVGEETGKLSSMMLRLAIFFEEEVTTTTKNLSSIIEPVLMLIIGGAVGFFAVSMLQPIYSSLGGI